MSFDYWTWQFFIFFIFDANNSIIDVTNLTYIRSNCLLLLYIRLYRFLLISQIIHHSKVNRFIFLLTILDRLQHTNSDQSINQVKKNKSGNDYNQILNQTQYFQ